ncbi:MAG: VCBS repeat-containing protein, partial [Candidatus Marinimicrobia bacterium]|nr:VCBS repeat-containing protein [Candidatus Neomarinimicrobiota bacterium]
MRFPFLFSCKKGKRIWPLFLLIGTLSAQNISFKDMAAEMGLNFVHDHGGTDQKFYVETMGSGCAVLDYDNDGDLDIFFLQGSPLPGWKKKTTLRNQLFRNDGDQFTDVTGESGLGDTSYGIGCAAADYDNDGDTDLYVTNFGPDILYRNEGDGTFADASYAVGISNPFWSASAAFFDADNDGWLDLFVTNYVEYSLEKNPWCGDQRKDQRAYCDPDVFMGISDVFYHNNGDGTFSDMSEKSNVMKGKGKGLGVIPADFDNDGDMDVYVANDKVMNNLFINDGTGIFKEDALFAGVGFNENGQAEAGMGVDFADYNRDGWLDLFVTNFSGESNTLYRNDKNGFLTDVTFAAGLGQPSLEVLGFGTNFVDLDLDGWEDIFVANGHVIDNIELFNPDYTHAQRKQVFMNRGDGTFIDKTDEIGGALQEPKVGRGAAFGDIDNDGDMDVVISNNNGQASLLINEGPPKNNWIGFLLKGRLYNRDAIGARVTVTSGGNS